MSDHLAIGAASAALGRLIQTALDVDVPGATVSYERPGGAGEADRVGVNVFLFQVTPNATLRNVDLPTRDGAGRLRSRPTAAIDLHYLLTFYGDATSFEPERICASAVRRLHEQPVLDRELIQAAIEDTSNAVHLGDADLADAPELVKLAPTPLNLEELSKLWSILFQTPYRLSAAYRASAVQLEARTATGRALQVRSRGGYVVPIAAVSITRIEAAAGPGAPIVWGGRIVVRGRGLGREDATLVVDGEAATPDPTTATLDRLEIDLVPLSFGGAVLRAGVAIARIRFAPPPGAPPTLAREVAPTPFLLRPRIVPGAVDAGPADADGRHAGSITVAVDPPVGEGQRVRLVLDRTAPRPPMGAVLVPELPAAFPAAELDFAFVDLEPGTYLVRAEVDGAESPLDVEDDPTDPAFGTIVGPRFAVP